MQLLKRSSRDDLDFKLSPFHQIRPLLSDLFCDNSEYRRTASDFVTLFTNCEPILLFCSPNKLTDEWLEVDLPELIKHAVEELVTNGDDTALKFLHRTSISGKLSYP
jgi:hypothetical protein